MSQRQLSVYHNGSSVRRMRMENYNSSGENGREWSELCDSHGFLGWDPLPPRQEGNVVDDEDDGDGSTVKERGSTPNNNSNSTNNNNNNNSSSRGLSRGLSNRTILIDGRYIMCSERSLSVNSICSGVTITDDAAAEEQQQQEDLNEEGEEEERMMVKLLPKSSSFRKNRCQSSWRSRGELVVEVSDRLNHDTNTGSGTTTDDDDGGIEEVMTRAVVLGATNDEHGSHTSSSSSVEVEEAATATAYSSSTRHQRKEWLGSRKESIRTLDLSENAIVEVWDTVMDETTTKSSSSSSLLSSSRRDDHLRRGAYTREESIRTLGDESVYSVDSKGFMAWNKMDHHRRRCRGKGGIDACNNSSREEEEEEELMDPSSQQRRRRGGGKEEESLRAETCGVDGKEEEGEMDDGGLLVDWEDQSNKKNSKVSLNDDSCNNDGESNESDGKNEGDDDVKLDATSSSSSFSLNETSEMSNTYNETSDFCPTQIKLHPSELGKRLSRRMRLIVADKLSSSVPSQPSSASTRLEGEESQKNLASSLPLASDLSDSVPPIETNNDDRRHRGFGTSREESTRTFDSWAQTVNSADDKNGGGLLVDWDLTMTKKINQLSLNESSNQLIAADGRGAQEEDDEADDDTTNNGDNDMDDAAAFLTEIIETLDEWQTNRSSIPPDFRPAQITLDGGVENTLSNRMRRMSKRLTSSLPGHTITTTSSASSSRRTSSGESSWNLVASSLTSELRSGRGSLASSWTGLSSSDHGFPKKTGSRSTTTTTAAAAAVPALSSSSLREGDANRPIRIGREDNVNIEELRRELLLRAASDGDNEGSNKPRRKSSLLGFI